MNDQQAELERLARMIEASGRYKVLREIAAPEIKSSFDADRKTGIILDVETNGLDPAVDEIVELAMLKFRYRIDGLIEGVCGTFERLQEPHNPLPPEITRLTGITNEMLKGRSIDPAEVFAFADANLIICHGARFDRRFVEKSWPFFAERAFACSISEVDWKSYGFSGAKLGYLVNECGFFHRAHRALDDCNALLAVLSKPLGQAGETAFAALLRHARTTTVRIWAENSPFEMRQQLRRRGYKWSDGSDGCPKAWYVDVPESDRETELLFLEREIYGREVVLATNTVTAWERYSVRA